MGGEEWIYYIVTVLAIFINFHVHFGPFLVTIFSHTLADYNVEHLFPSYITNHTTGPDLRTSIKGHVKDQWTCCLTVYIMVHWEGNTRGCDLTYDWKCHSSGLMHHSVRVSWLCTTVDKYLDLLDKQRLPLHWFTL